MLAQTYPDFELIISDNASTDATAEICRDYGARDTRIRYVRQRVNIGAGPNHNGLVPLAQGRFFKWAAHDDLYAPTLLERCIGVLENDPEPVLVHSWDAVVDEQGHEIGREPYGLDTGSPSPSVRLRSLLRVPDGNDFYGVVRTGVLRRVRPHGSYAGADRTFLASLGLQGSFRQVPEVLYFRRDHADRASRAPSRRARAAALDPARWNRWRHPMIRMHGEYLLGYADAIRLAHLGPAESARCSAAVVGWAARASWSRVEGARMELASTRRDPC